MTPDRRLAAFAGVVYAVTLLAHVGYLRRLLPAMAAIHEGLGGPLPLLSSLYAGMGGVVTLALAGGLVASVLAAAGVGVLPRAATALAAAATVLLVSCGAAMLALQQATGTVVADALLAARGQVGLAERGTMALLAGDVARAEKELTAARNLEPASGLACVGSPGYAALQLAEVWRAQGRVDDARQGYADAIAASEGRTCVDARSPYSVAATARTRLATLGTPPVTPAGASQAVR